VVHSLSLIELKRALGTLLQAEEIMQTRTCDACCQPTLQLHKALPYAEQPEALPPMDETTEELSATPLAPLPP
jgi:hypothetical protein